MVRWSLVSISHWSLVTGPPGRPSVAEARSSPHPSALFRPCPTVNPPLVEPGDGFDGAERAGSRSDGCKQGRNSADGCGEDRASDEQTALFSAPVTRVSGVREERRWPTGEVQVVTRQPPGADGVQVAARIITAVVVAC